jgi:hypothetical protein
MRCAGGSFPALLIAGPAAAAEIIGGLSQNRVQLTELRGPRS